MKANFHSALDAVLQHEGGFVNDPRDPGGATNRGVTQAVYNDYRHKHGLPQQSVRAIADEEVAAIYLTRYWQPVRGDDLPSGVDYAAFDFAVNSGVNRAIRFLQRVSGAIEDGQFGPKTLAAVKAVPPITLIRALSCERQSFLQSLSTFDHFGKGWTRRVSEVRTAAEAMA